MQLKEFEQAFWAAVRTDLKAFMQHAFGTVYPGKELIVNWHLDAIVRELELSAEGKSPRLIINLPPRHLKSFIVSVAWPAFLMGQDPTLKIFSVSYSQELAYALARDFKRIVDSDWYRKLYPNMQWAKVTEGEMVSSTGGFRYAVSVGGSLTGRGADLIIIDDPSKPEEAVSDKARQSLNDWYRSTLLSRLDDKERSAIVLVMQRLHVNDLTGFVEESGGYRKLAFPAIAKKDEVIELRGGRTHFRREGDPLQEGRESLKVLMRMRDEISPFNFESQYQQSPETPDGMLFKRHWFQLVERAPKIDASMQLCVSIDSASSTSSTADFSAISFVGRVGSKIYVLHAQRGRWDYETLKERALKYIDTYASHRRNLTFVVEAAGTGLSLLQYLLDKPYKTGNLRVFHYRPNVDKVIRAAKALPTFAAGRIHIVNAPGNTWVEPYLNEFASFPNGRYDDQVDSLVQLVVSESRAFLGPGYSNE